MIRPLRKRHRISWIVILVIISILFLKLYRSPDTFREKGVAALAEPLAFVESTTAGSENFEARLGTLESGEKVLQFNLRTFFRSPAAGVYLSGNREGDPADYQLLGELNELGNYQFKFSMPAPSYQLLIYDPIKKLKLETLNFQ